MTIVLSVKSEFLDFYLFRIEYLVWYLPNELHRSQLDIFIAEES